MPGEAIEWKKFGLYVPDPDNPSGEWIGVLSGVGIDDKGKPKELDWPFEMRLRYSKRGELLCTGLRIGEGTDWRPKSNITRRMLVAIPLVAVLRYIAEHENSPEIDPEIRRRLANAFPFELALPPGGGWVRPGPKGHPPEVYIEAAERFAAEYQGGQVRPAEVYRRMAAAGPWDESTVRRHVHKGWELRRDLKPEGIRTCPELSQAHVFSSHLRPVRRSQTGPFAGES